MESNLAVAILVASALTAAFFAYFYSMKRQPFLLLWTAGWSLLALRYLGPALGHSLPTVGWQVALNHWLLAAAALLFLASARLYSEKDPWARPLAGAAAGFALWAGAWQVGWLSLTPEGGVGVILLVTAYVFYTESRRQETIADAFLAATFALWGAILCAAPFLKRGGYLTGDSSIFILVPQLFTAPLMVMAMYEEEKRRVERNMLALSNLNLATSGFAASETQKMLSHALDRILNVVRIPAGALFLHHGDPHGPTALVAAGLSEAFCARSQEEGVDDHLVSLVARLGGLVAFRDLTRDSAWAALDRDDSFRRFRQLATSQGLRTVVAISLQAKEQAFGVLLLCTPDSRRFTAAELRLLLALGHQIGMAVENGYLIQQTARRTEELHILNEIGRALSSTLESDTLFEKIYTEMRRLFDVDNFYIAFYDSARDIVRFELEVNNGAPLPKRFRPAGNHLTEYLVRTCEPVLIRENFAEEVRKLGIQPLQQTGCFCGVPLVVYDRAFGVMAVHSPQERLFDEGHLELMRVLANEASIAIENARLFRDEQVKTRHLSLVNDISRKAITTFDPDEMLAKIAEALEQGLSYDHVGIGVLDYTYKEVAIQAEAGSRRGALNRRVAFAQGLLGSVARSGQMQIIRDYGAPESVPAPVLEDSASAIALPVTYADQLLAILYVETSQRSDFSEEEVLLLQTLADLIAGALHGALTFQRAQEQAITDGLTGVKTHRFFVEALSAEWKRSTRAGRSFSVALIDLDRFKFVNDFYGHLDGDIVLKRVGSLLEETCRRSDVIARYGGDEFVILMPETTVEQARQLTGKLRANVCADPILREKNVTASFGIASFPLHGSTPQELIQVADSSMYLSKHQGGNAVSTADNYDPNEAKKWKRDVLDAYLGVTLKRLYASGPEAFAEIYGRLEQFSRSLAQSESTGKGAPPAGNGSSSAAPSNGDSAQAVPPTVIETVSSLAIAIDSKDHFTQGHSQKVAAYSALLAEAAGLAAADVEQIRLGGLLHDLGKVAIPENILNKSGPLNPDEWDTMKSHVDYGAKLLGTLHGLERICLMVRHHHEFFDGSGYPDCLAGLKIPLGARIIAIADAYDTITTERTYKKAHSADDALAEIERCGGQQFDHELVQHFLRAVRQMPQPLLEIAPTPVSSSAASAGPSADR